MTSPMYSSGVTTSTAMIGSIRMGLALRAASRKAAVAAILKAMSDESTSWCLPSVRVTFRSTTGKPARGPVVMASCMPLSTAGMYSRGMRPPLTSLANS